MKEKIVCGAETEVKVTHSDGKVVKYIAVCQKRPKHWGKHQEVIEW